MFSLLLSKNLFQSNKFCCFFLTLSIAYFFSNYCKLITADLYPLWHSQPASCVCVHVCGQGKQYVSRLPYKISSKPLTFSRTLNNWGVYGHWHLWQSRKIDVCWWGSISDHSSQPLSVVELTLPPWCQALQCWLPDGTRLTVPGLLCHWCFTGVINIIQSLSALISPLFLHASHLVTFSFAAFTFERC